MAQSVVVKLYHLYISIMLHDFQKLQWLMWKNVWIASLEFLRERNGISMEFEIRPGGDPLTNVPVKSREIFLKHV